jgi:hypothetical protein
MSDPSSSLPRWLTVALVAALAVGAVLGAVPSDRVIGDGVDLFGTFWFYWFIGHCLETLSSPSFTDLMFHPLGKDIFSHTGNNFVDAIAAQPFRWVFGYPRYQPVFVAFLLGLNGLCFAPLARHLLGRGSVAALLATALWTVNPFVLFECMAGRFTQATLWFLPGAVLAMLRIGRPGRSLARDALLLGGLTALQAWTYWFMGYFMALAFGWIALARLLRPEGVERRRMVQGWAMAAGVCAVGVLPGVIAMVGSASDGAVPGLVDAQEHGIFEMPRGHASNLPRSLHGLVLMERHGQPQLTTLTWMLGGLTVLVGARRRLLWGGLALVVAFFSIGPAWPLTDGRTVSMPAYLALYNLLPFFDRLWFPYRMLPLVFLPLCLGAGEVLQRVEQRRPWLAGGLAVAVLGGALAEQHHNLAFPLVTRELPVPAVYEELRDREGALIELPIGLARISIAHQPIHEQPVFGGMAENAPLFWPEGYRQQQRNNPVARFLFAAVDDPTEATASFRDVHLQRLLDQGFRWVVLDRHYVDANVHRSSLARRDISLRQQAPFLVTERISRELGPPVAADGSLLVWDLRAWTEDGPQAPPGPPWPPALQPTAADLDTRTWPLEDMPAYERHMRERGRIVDHH